MEEINARKTEYAYLVGIHVRGSRPLLSVAQSLDELAQLADTAGLQVIGMADQNVDRIDPKTFIGSGKVEEIKLEIAEYERITVIFDDELSPRHQRELENAFGENVKVLDRSALIIDIFGQHAHTREGRLQIELAQYEYLLPRLTRQWTHLERQAGGGAMRAGTGGVGLRGPGESQLEVDRREIARIIARLKRDLNQVRAHRGRHRNQRDKTGIPVVSMVGYTNAGKSSLMKRLTNADIYIADQLFATLDPTTRKITLPTNKEILMTDTVGFIQKLPTTLVAAFRATLEEVNMADIILLVVDSAHPLALQHIEAVEDTLAEIDVPRLPHILVLNKCDLWDNPHEAQRFQDLGYDHIVTVSAHTGEGLGDLLQTISDVLLESMVAFDAHFTFAQGDIVSQIHRQGIVEEEQYDAEGVQLRGHMPTALADYLIQQNLIRGTTNHANPSSSD